MSRALLVPAFLLSACASTPTIDVASGILQGTVWYAGAPCPAAQPRNTPPCDGPYVGFQIVVLDEEGVRFVASTVTDAAGQYRVTLEGDRSYVVRIPSSTGIKSQSVRVPAGQTVRLDLTVDIGVR